MAVTWRTWRASAFKGGGSLTQLPFDYQCAGGSPSPALSPHGSGGGARSGWRADDRRDAGSRRLGYWPRRRRGRAGPARSETTPPVVTNMLGVVVPVAWSRCRRDRVHALGSRSRAPHPRAPQSFPLFLSLSLSPWTPPPSGSAPPERPPCPGGLGCNSDTQADLHSHPHHGYCCFSSTAGFHPPPAPRPADHPVTRV